MRKSMKASLAAGAGAFAMAWLGLHAAIAADMQYPQGEYEAPPPQAYGPPPGAEGYGYPPPPPAVAYGYPPPVPFYGSPVYVAVPGPYYAPFRRGGYWPHYAYGYGHWGHGYRRW